MTPSRTPDRPPRPVVVIPYDPGWPHAFERERAALRAVLGPACAVHHVGSTSVPGLAAKPVIDICVGAPTLGYLDDRERAMVAAGYEARGAYGIPRRRYFVRGGGGTTRVHVHAFRADGPEVDRHVRFRDYLRAHPAEAARYGELKTRLAAAHPDDRAAYQAGKADLIAEIQVAASVWSA